MTEKENDGLTKKQKLLYGAIGSLIISFVIGQYFTQFIVLAVGLFVLYLREK